MRRVFEVECLCESDKLRTRGKRHVRVYIYELFGEERRGKDGGSSYMSFDN